MDSHMPNSKWKSWRPALGTHRWLSCKGNQPIYKSLARPWMRMSPLLPVNMFLYHSSTFSLHKPCYRLFSGFIKSRVIYISSANYIEQTTSRYLFRIKKSYQSHIQSKMHITSLQRELLQPVYLSRSMIDNSQIHWITSNFNQPDLSHKQSC